MADVKKFKLMGKFRQCDFMEVLFFQLFRIHIRLDSTLARKQRKNYKNFGNLFAIFGGCVPVFKR